MIDIIEVEFVVCFSQSAIGEDEIGITGDGLIEQYRRPEVAFFLVFTFIISALVNQGRRFDIKIVSVEVGGRPFFDGCFLARRYLGLELAGDFLRNLSLNRKYIGQFTIVSLSPNMGIGARIDKLGIDPRAVCDSLNATFQNMGYPKHTADFAKVTWCAALVLRYRSTANNF